MRNIRPLDALLPKTRQGILAATLVQPQKACAYTRVTAKVIADLEQGGLPWLKPWSGDYALRSLSQLSRSLGIDR